METIEELTKYVYSKALMYMEESGEKVEKFPLSIVDFVIEYAAGSCNFPESFSEKRIVADLQKGKNSLAMACTDVYSKIGAEGEVSHSENGTSRTYQASWISPGLLSFLPNYVGFFEI